jgi:subtilisin family serine protease
VFRASAETPKFMRGGSLVYFATVLLFWSVPVEAAGRLIVRVNGGLPVIQAACRLAGCTVAENIDGALSQVYLVTSPDFLDVTAIAQTLSSAIGVLDVEPDLLASVADSSRDFPPSLSDTTPVTYYGSTVPEGYIRQPAMQMIRLPQASAAYPTDSGTGIVAVIDTGVDPNHPALAAVLLRGYDFMRNQAGADETLDINTGGSSPVLSAQPFWISPNTAADVSQSTASVVDGNSQYGDFGHGTMVAGIIHLVAPSARILPLKAFNADGTGYTSDILRAIYYAVEQHANVLNMSFTLAGYSREVATALDLATATGMISVAAAGNNGQQILVYPAALWDVMGVASIANDGELSAFSNYGPQLVWVAAPGEGIVTTYPFSTYAAGWGTSFSAPFVSGTAALLLSVNRFCDQYGSSQSTAHAAPMNPNAGHGLLDVPQAMQAWMQATGQQVYWNAGR